MIAIIDYGMGNLKNIYKALKFAGAACIITSDSKEVEDADGVILPGVGAFRDAIECIKNANLNNAIKTSVQQGKPFLGICLGMQLLFDKSYENGIYNGLSIIKGEVKLIEAKVKIPHMGWNNLIIKNNEDPLLYGVKDASCYFVHSYYCMPYDKEQITSAAEYGIEVTASAWDKNVHGLQFHPEKSGDTGIKMLKNFISIVK